MSVARATIGTMPKVRITIKQETPYWRHASAALLQEVSDRAEANSRRPFFRGLSRLLGEEPVGPLPEPSVASKPYWCPDCNNWANNAPSSHFIGCPSRTHDLEKADTRAQKALDDGLGIPGPS